MDTHIGDLHPSIVGKTASQLALARTILSDSQRQRNRDNSRITKQDSSVRRGYEACL